MRRMACMAATIAISIPALPGALAQGSDAKARGWAAGCTTCHGPDGRSEGGMPSIAGRDAGELLQLLLEFRAGRRPATVMHQHAKGYSEDQLRRIAAYFSSRPK